MNLLVVVHTLSLSVLCVWFVWTLEQHPNQINIISDHDISTDQMLLLPSEYDQIFKNFICSFIARVRTSTTSVHI